MLEKNPEREWADDYEGTLTLRSLDSSGIQELKTRKIERAKARGQECLSKNCSNKICSLEDAVRKYGGKPDDLQDVLNCMRAGTLLKRDLNAFFCKDCSNRLKTRAPGRPKK